MKDIRSFVKKVKEAGGRADDPEAMLAAMKSIEVERRQKRQEQLTTGLGGTLRALRSSSASLGAGRAITAKSAKTELDIKSGSLMDKQCVVLDVVCLGFVWGGFSFACLRLRCVSWCVRPRRERMRDRMRKQQAAFEEKQRRAAEEKAAGL